MANLFGKPSERDLQEASQVGRRAALLFPDLAATLLLCGDVAWLSPASGAPTKLSPEATQRLLERIVDEASLSLRFKAPSLSGETGRYVRSSFGIGCKGPGAPLLYRICPECAQARALSALFGEGATLKSAGLV